MISGHYNYPTLSNHHTHEVIVRSPNYLDFQSTLIELEKRWGAGVLKPARTHHGIEVLPTGFTQLDALLGGGVPRGQLTELIGKPTSGRSTLAYHLIASAHKKSEPVVYLDEAGAFDPDYAVRCGIKLPNLLLVRTQPATRLDLLQDVVASRVPGMVVLSSTAAQDQRLLVALIDRIHPVLTSSPCILLLLGKSPISSLATLRLQTELQRWVMQGEDIAGFQTKVTLLKSRRGNEGKYVDLTIYFPAGQP